MNPREFVTKWQNVTLKERSGYQEHFIDVCRLVGHPTPAEMDPNGSFFTFEAGASKLAGGQGFADVWYNDHFAWEYKGQHANLDKAYQQILQYREDLRNPPLLVVCDFDRIIINTNFTNTIKKVYTVTLNDLLTPQGFGTLKAVFTNPNALRIDQTPDQVTEEAAGQFGEIARLLNQYGENPPTIAHFLIQLLFCLFAEDAGLLPQHLLTNLITRTRTRPKEFSVLLQQVFTAMSNGGWFGAEEIMHFDGHLFDNTLALSLDSQSMDILAKVSTLDWAQIKPSIFGTLFERGLDPSKRSQLGAHYTSEEDILLIVEPVLMAPLRRRWNEVKEQAATIVAQRNRVKGQKRANLDKKLQSLLMGFAEELAAIQVLDPACGSGNFLYIALRLLLELEQEVIYHTTQLGLPGFFPRVNPAQLHGIEINEYAHQLAQATIWIGYIQWLRDNGYGFPSQPILKPLDNIQNEDAILAFDEHGQPIEPEWPKADVIIGNPPFLGGKRLRSELGDDVVDALFFVYKDRIPLEADLVTYWFEKARSLIERGRTQRAGLLATQGIRGGANRKVLERIKTTGDIFWAISDRDWILDGANVHVSMVGFDNGSQIDRNLNEKKVEEINSNLTTDIDLTQARRLLENANLSFMGVTPAGPFDIPGDLARQMLSISGNPNGCPNSDVIHPYYNGVDITSGTRDVWIIDFTSLTEEQAAQYEAPFEYTRNVVKPFREKSRIPDQPWWQFTRGRPTMRSILSTLSRYIGTSMVAKHRIFTWLPASVIPANLVIVIARSDVYFFGVLHNRLHELWARAMGTQLREAKSGFRYTPTTTFETYPFPWPPGKEPTGDPRVEAIAQAARELVELRENWLNPPDTSPEELKKRTLTNLYNLRPTWLDNAHRKLDQAVLAAYGWPDNLSDNEILGRLLELNLQRATASKG